GWVIFRSTLMLAFIQLYGGFVWAGFNLATANFIFDAVQKKNIPKISAYFNSFNNLFAFIGSISGGSAIYFLSNSQILVKYNFSPWAGLFLISCLIRLVLPIFFIGKFREVRPVEVSPPAGYFYLYRPAMNMINSFAWISARFKKLQPGADSK
ncbi:MAG TPA: hypothetical protein DC049_18480, partial [Spirochaetia bacterium]|nr:hypothetical protein [Spirochaetia bacterium]